jgi:hypothetical protein
MQLAGSLRVALPVALLAFALGLTACGDRTASGSQGGALTIGSPVDSALPVEEALRRFRTGLSDPGRLRGGAPSLPELVGRFLTLLEHRDSAGLAALAIDLREFAYLYYPTSIQSRPPNDLPPGLVWTMLQGQSREGLFHALQELGGRPLRYLDHTCQPRTEGVNTIWGYCTVRVIGSPADTLEGSLFGLVIERDGTFKFVSYANKL